MEECIHYKIDDTCICRAIEDEWFEYCHALGEDCPAYKTIEKQLEIEERIRGRVEAFTHKPFKSCIPPTKLAKYMKEQKRRGKRNG